VLMIVINQLGLWHMWLIPTSQNSKASHPYMIEHH